MSIVSNPTIEHPPARQRARISAVTAGGTEVVFEDRPGCSRTLAVPALPDPARARRLAAALQRVVWQRIAADGSHSTVAAVRRRRPVYVRVPAGTALGLLQAGVPTTVDPEPSP